MNASQSLQSRWRSNHDDKDNDVDGDERFDDDDDVKNVEGQVYGGDDDVHGGADDDDDGFDQMCKQLDNIYSQFEGRAQFSLVPNHCLKLSTPAPPYLLSMKIK